MHHIFSPNIYDSLFSACSGAIDAAVKVLPSVTSASVSLLGNSMEVVYDPSITSAQTIIKTVTDLGYEALQWETSNIDAPEVKTVNERVVQISIEATCGYVYALVFWQGCIQALRRT
jgi:copper chaperone CopZ